MRLTSMTDFALRLLMYLTQQQQEQQRQGEPERLCTIAEVARFHDISEAHLMKVTHQLGLQGFVETVRGKGGGLRLARAPAEIDLGAVVRGMEADFRIAECFASDGQCVLIGACRLATVLDEALSRFLVHLDGHTLADIVPDRMTTVNGAAAVRRVEWLDRR